MKRKIIALNGWPKSGKSAVAEILQRRYGAVIVDDGAILREAAPILFKGVTLEDCYSQDGKAKPITINGEVFTVRQALGYLGDALEDMFGENYVPDQTVRRLADLPDAPYFVLPSVRKGQGWFYRTHGADVWEIDRSGNPPSENAFDRWDARAVTHKIHNDGGLGDLEDIVQHLMHKVHVDGGFATLHMAA